jgi:hypothetical protein
LQFKLANTFNLLNQSSVKSISSYDDTFVIGDATNNKVYVYYNDETTGSFIQTPVTISSPSSGINFGISLSLAGNAGVGTNLNIFIGATFKQNTSSNDGSVYVYTGLADTWIQTQEIVGENFSNGFFGSSICGYVEVAKQYLIVGAPGVDLAKGRAYVYKLTLGTWALESALNAPSPLADDQYGSYVSLWNTQALVCSINQSAGQGALYTYKEGAGVWDFVDEHDSPSGAQGFATTAIIFTDLIYTYLSVGNGYTLSYDSIGNVWNQSIFINFNQIYIKNTVSKSVYHSTEENTTLILELTTPLYGIFNVTALYLKNSLYLIDNHNHTVYFNENGVYFASSIANGNYTGNDLATAVQTAMNNAGNYTYIVGYNSTAKKYEVSCTNGVFSFGSNSTTSYKDSMQNKVLGFYDNNNSLVGNYYLSDNQANLDISSRIGVNILEAISLTPVRYNNPFTETALMATLNSAKDAFVIASSENQKLNFPNRTSVLTVTFPSLDGGGQNLNINTNNFSITLTKVS